MDDRTPPAPREPAPAAFPPVSTMSASGLPAPAKAAPEVVASRGRVLRVLGVGLLVAIVLGAAGLLVYRYTVRDTGQSTITGGVLTETPSGVYFSNPTEKIAFVAPAGWSRYPTASAQIMLRGGGCSFGLLEQRTNLTVAAFADAEAKDMKRRHPEAIPIIAPRTLAGKSGLAFTGAYADSAGGPMSQTYILIDRGPNVITLIETATDPTCAQSFASVEDSLHL